MTLRPDKCPSCGRAVSLSDGFCSGCGTTLSGTGAGTDVTPVAVEHLTNCIQCGGPMLPGDRFCAGCGAGRVGPSPPGKSQWAAIADRLARAAAGEFQIIKELGRGAMGAVYLAREVALDRRVAIKIISPALLLDEHMVERFRLEARTVASLRHPHVIDIFAVRQFADLHYFVMDYVDGCTLRELIKDHGTLETSVVRALLVQIGGALAYAHRRRSPVIHRDIKPANIMIDSDGRGIVTDFGISKATEAKAGLTRTGLIIGTPEYMSPEQCRGEPVSGASDQYSLGVVAYEAICGRAPFTGTPYEVMIAHSSTEPTPIRELRPDCPDDLADAVTRMLAKEPEDRWEDLDELIQAVGGVAAGHSRSVRNRLVELVAPSVVDDLALLDNGAITPIEPSDDLLDEENAPASVILAPLPETILPGDTLELDARVLSSAGPPVPDMHLSWSTSDPAVATVDAGRVLAVAPGAAIITATAGGVETSITLTVTDPGIRHGIGDVQIEDLPETLHAGRSAPVRAVVIDTDGVPVDEPVAWETDDPSVAVVEQGLLCGVAPGTVTVTARCGELVDAVTIRVLAAVVEPSRPAAVVEPSRPQAAKEPAPAGPPVVTSIRVTGVPSRVRVGHEFKLKAATLDALGSPAAGRVEWRSADPEVATVDAKGTVQALQPGTTELVAAVGDAEEKRVLVVHPGRREAGTGFPGWAVAAAGAAVIAVVLLVVLGLPGGGGEDAPPPASTAAAAPDVAGVTVPEEAVTLDVGQGQPLEATPVDGSGQPVAGASVTWTMDDPAVASIDASGWLVALAGGSTVARASFGSFEAAVRITVRPELPETQVAVGGAAGQRPGNATVAADPAGPAATERPAPSPPAGPAEEAGQRPGAGGTPGDTPPGSNPAVPDSASTGAGGATSGAATPDPSTTRPPAEGAPEEVAPTRPAPPNVSRVTLRAPRRELNEGESMDMVLDAVDRAGEPTEVPPGATLWRSSDETVLTVEDGHVTAVGAGSADITADVGGDLGVTVTLGVRPAVVAVEIVGEAERELRTGATLTLEARVIGPTGPLIRAEGLTWRSDTPSVASVDQNGRVTAVAPGRAVITASRGTHTATVAIRVTSAP